VTTLSRNLLLMIEESNLQLDKSVLDDVTIDLAAPLNVVPDQMLKMQYEQEKETLQGKLDQVEKERTFLKSQLDDIMRARDYFVFRSRDLEKENTFLSEVVQSLELRLEQRRKQVEFLVDKGSQIHSINERYYQICDENCKIRSEIRETEKKLEKENQEVEKRNSIIIDKEKEIEQLRKELRAKEASLDKMASSLISMKTRVIGFEVEVAKFLVDKIYEKFDPSEAKLIVVQNEDTHKSHLDVVVNGKRHVHDMDTIQDLRTSKNNPDRFIILFKVHLFIRLIRFECHSMFPLVDSTWFFRIRNSIYLLLQFVMGVFMC